MQATTPDLKPAPRGRSALFQGHRARHPLPDELWTSGTFAVCLFDHRNSFTTGCAKPGTQCYRCGHKRLYRKPGFGRSWRISRQDSSARRYQKFSKLTGLDTSLTVDQLRVQLEADINSAPQTSYQRADPHHHLRRVARHLLLPAGVLGREKFTGGRV